MSSKKDKLLESAQKFIAKGQLDRAIRDYVQVVALDSDVRHRQRLAELLVRAGRKEEAIGQYEAIGKYYSDHAFFLKAIAVYKQIQKLDPGNVGITLNLASLNEKQGLIGNALAEYNNALSYCQKTRQLPEAIKVLDQMLIADPANLNTLLKLAETYYSAGMHEKSYDQFTKLAMHLGKSGDESAFMQICNRVASLYPDRKDFLLELMSALVEEGDFSAAIHHLVVMTGNDNGNRRAWELLAEAYQRQGNHEQHTATLQRMVSLFPEEPSFRENMQGASPEKSAKREVVSPEVAPPDEPFFPTQGPVAGGEPTAPPETDDSDVPWEEEVDLGLADEPGVSEPSPHAHELPVGLGSEIADEEPFLAEGTIPGSEGSFPEVPALPDEFSEIDLELEADVSVDNHTVSALGENAGETPLMDGFGEIDLEVDEREDADSFGLGSCSVDADSGGLAPLDDFSKIDLELDSADTIDSDVSVLQDADDELSLPDYSPEIDLELGAEDDADGGIFGVADADAGELPHLLDDVLEVDLDIDDGEAAENRDIPEPLGSDIRQTFLLNDVPGIELELDVEEVADGDIPDLQVPDEVPELNLEVNGDKPHLSLDDLLAETGEGATDASGLFDLGAELRQEESEGSDATESSKYSLDGLFSVFKEVVDQQLDQGDTETHYNLGIAYREMGLYDDAISEFQAASRAPERTADCLTLQGICHRDKGDVANAEAAFRTGMALGRLSRGEELSLKYELALLLEGAGRLEESVQLYREVRSDDPDFREVGSRIAAISGERETMAEELDLLELEEEA